MMTVDPDDVRRMEAVLTDFTTAMLDKMKSKAREGWYAWDEPENLSDMRERLADHVRRGDDQMVDVANLAMFIWHITRQHPEEKRKG